jgi:hypothetical protein
LDGDSLSYYWTCRAGSFSYSSGYAASWQGVSQDGQYYISVTVSDGKSIESDSVAVTIRDVPVNTPPSQPYNPNPRNGSSEVSRNTSLSWMCNDADGDRLSFDVFLGTNESLTSLISVWRDISEFSVQPEELVGRQYYWRVVARDSCGTEAQGAVWYFLFLTEYGDLYFTSDSSTSWQTDGPVTVEYGNLVAVNYTESEMQGSALLLEPIDFDRSTHLTFVWIAEVQSNASYAFYAADSPDNMQSIPFSEGSGGRMVAQIDLFMSAQIYCAFLFVLPPQGSVRLSNIRGYGI